MTSRVWNDRPTDAAARRGRSRQPSRAAPPFDVAIRRGEARDALCVAALGMQVFLDTYATEGIRRSLAREAIDTLSPAAVAELLGRPATTFLLAETNGHLVGFAQLNARAGHALVPGAAPAELKRLYVQERFTGRGIGRMLLRGTEATARDEGASVIWLVAWAGNVRALGFYAREGYAELVSVPFAVEDERYENRLFAKALADAR